MSYFPNAFKKVFVGSSFVTSGKTEDLTAGQFGFFDTTTWTATTAGDNLAQVVLAMGSYHTVDKVGTHGGYKESVKSQIISMRDVHRVWKVNGRTSQQQIVQLGWDGSDDTTSPKFVCGKNYNLRIDLKGSPALRFLNHNMYHTFSVFTGCCTNVDTPESVDPISILLQFAEQINGDPIFSQFISAAVVTTDGADSDSDPDVVDPDTYVTLTDSGDIDAAIGALQLTMAYVDTKFGDCSFDPRDHFELEPVVITSAELTDDSGDPCSDFKQLTFTETQAPRTADGTGEMVLRELIMSNNYRQEVYQFDPRMREAEDINSIFTNVSRTGLYTSYYILHTVSRRSNPTGVYDNDLYLIQISVPEGTNMAGLENWFNNFISPSWGTIEDLSGA